MGARGCVRMLAGAPALPPRDAGDAARQSTVPETLDCNMRELYIHSACRNRFSLDAEVRIASIGVMENLKIDSISGEKNPFPHFAIGLRDAGTAWDAPTRRPHWRASEPFQGRGTARESFQHRANRSQSVGTNSSHHL